MLLKTSTLLHYAMPGRTTIYFIYTNFSAAQHHGHFEK